MAVYRITGLKAAINDLPCLTKFNLNISGLDTVNACSASDGAVFRTEGNADWGGIAYGKGLPAKYPGDFFKFTASDRDGQGWQSDDPDGVLGALVTRVHIFCPISTGRHIYHHLYFSAGTGGISKGAYQAMDATTPNPLSAKGRAFSLDDEVVKGVDHWDFDIRGNETLPVWPSHMDGWPVRDVGNIDATIRWRQLFKTMDVIPTINSFHKFKLHTTAALYYEIQWGQVLQVPTEYPVMGKPGGPAEYIKMELGVAKFTGYEDGTKGFINKPGGVPYWPTPA